jgi:propionate catabolism operon transcriptional regulator
MPADKIKPFVSATARLDSRVRLCLISYKPLSALANTLLHEFSDRAEIDVFDETFGAALEIANQRERLGLVDAFVSAGGNMATLRGTVKAPVASIEIGGFDLLLALIKARKYSPRVGVLTYERTVAELDAMKSLLNIEICQRTYRNHEQAESAVRELRDLGITVVVGSSVVVVTAERLGMHAILAYTPAGVRRGIEDAIELARVSRLERARYSLISGVLNSLREAVLAIDASGLLIAVNPPMEVLLGSARSTLLGRSLKEVAPEIYSPRGFEQGDEQVSQVLRFRNREWIAHHSPICDDQGMTGATLTLYDANIIQDADTSLRTQRKARALKVAKHSFADLRGVSPALRQTVATAERYARTNLTVLISGESGTGKEMFAQAIHNASARSNKPFIALNCAAFPETLLESELFGYEEGAFTGARRGGKRGLFEAAHTGSLLLDEIGDMPMLLQSRLLRVLQEREVVRLGGIAPIPIDVRIIAATHQPLREMVRERRFREDLFYRVNILQITLPPLRERAGDILPLAQRFLAACLDNLGCAHDPERLLAPLANQLNTYQWRGNVRELENICERLGMFFSQYDRIEDVRYPALALDCPEMFFGGAVEHLVPMAQQIHQALAACQGNRFDTARYLGISRSTLWRRMQAMSHETLKNDA